MRFKPELIGVLYFFFTTLSPQCIPKVSQWFLLSLSDLTLLRFTSHSFVPGPYHIPFMLQQEQQLPGWSPCNLSSLSLCVLCNGGQIKYPHCPPEVAKLNSSTWQAELFSNCILFPRYFPTLILSVEFSSTIIYSSPSFLLWICYFNASFFIQASW